LLTLFGITIPTVQAAGGLVLASMGWGMLGSNDRD
jgi:small neutral amino acid transporter SnatA (MarC family)